MKAYIIPALLVFLVSCSEDDVTVYSVDAALAPYVEAFYAEAEKYGRVFPRENLIVILKKDLTVTARTIRQVNSRDGNQTTIEMSEDYFSSHDAACIESVMFHELGHARLMRGHTNTYSIMNTITGESCYMNGYPGARESLIKELFTTQ